MESMSIRLLIADMDTPAAADLYCRAFGLSLNYWEGPEKGPYALAYLARDGKVKIVIEEYLGGGQTLCQARREAGICFELAFGIREGVKRAWEALKEQGTVLSEPGPEDKLPYVGAVRDRFSVEWMFYYNRCDK